MENNNTENAFRQHHNALRKLSKGRMVWRSKWVELVESGDNLKLVIRHATYRRPPK